MNWLIRHLGTLHGRIATGLSAILAAVAFARPGGPWTFEWSGFVALVIALSTWIIAELQHAAEPYPHDIALFSRIVDAFSDAERHFLRVHDFGQPFGRSQYAGVREVTYWEGARATFIDARLEKRWAPLRQRIDDLFGLIGATTVPHRHLAEHQTVRLRREDGDPPNRQTELEAKALNDASGELVEMLEEFELFGRTRLRV